MTATLSLPTQPQLSPAPLLQAPPRLTLRRTDAASASLMDPHFAHAPATVALCEGLAVGFSTGDRMLSYHDLAKAHSDVHTTWRSSAQALVASAKDKTGRIKILTRSASALTGVNTQAANRCQEVRIDAGTAALATDFLGHPETFTLLHSHLMALMGGKCHYLVPSRRTLIAVPGSSTPARLQRWARDLAEDADTREALLAHPVEFHRGFPTAMSGPACTEKRSFTSASHPLL